MAAQHHLPVLLLICLSQVQGQGCGEGRQCLHYSCCHMWGRVEEEKLQAWAAQAVEDILVSERKAYNGNLSEFRDQYLVGILALQANQSTNSSTEKLQEFHDQYLIDLTALQALQPNPHRQRQAHHAQLRELRNMMLDNLKICSRGGLPRGEDSEEWRCCQEQANLSSRVYNISSEGRIECRSHADCPPPVSVSLPVGLSGAQDSTYCRSRVCHRISRVCHRISYQVTNCGPARTVGSVGQPITVSSNVGGLGSRSITGLHNMNTKGSLPVR